MIKKKKRQTHLKSSSYQKNTSIGNARAKMSSRNTRLELNAFDFRYLYVNIRKKYNRIKM